MRYVALCGAVDDRSHPCASLAERTELRELYRSESLILFGAPATRSRIVGMDGGAVVGSLFGHANGARQTAPLLDLGASDAPAERLLSAYWGAYVAFLEPGRDGSIDVLRDPSGALACWYCVRGRTAIVTSDLALLTRAGLLRAGVDWPALTRHLAFPYLASHLTCLSGILELQPGEILHVTPNGLRTSVGWSLWTHARRANAADAQAFADELRARIVRATIALAADHDRVIASVSGGLDSSIVASALAEGTTDLSLMTVATDDPDGDERDYARLLAGHLRRPLHERYYDPRHVHIDRTDAAALPRPSGRIFAQSLKPLRSALARELGATALFTGNGGDAVFLYMPSVSLLLDRLEAEGLARIWPSVVDLGTLSGCGVGHVVTALWRRVRERRRQPRDRPELRFLTPEAIDAAQCPNGPAEAAPSDIPPGKALHVAAIRRNHVYLGVDADDEELAVLSPLLTQPVQELCLTLPSWRWITGGRNRAPARRAFATMLPAEIVARTSKGGPDAFCIAVLGAQRTIARGMMLDGLLVRHHIVDGAELERFLNWEGPPLGPDYQRFLRLVDAEAWARAWTARLETRPGSA